MKRLKCAKRAQIIYSNEYFIEKHSINKNNITLSSKNLKKL